MSAGDDSARTRLPTPRVAPGRVVDAREPGEGDGHRRARRVVSLYAGAAVAATALAAGATWGAARWTQLSPVLVGVIVGLVFIAVTTLVLERLLRRWASRLAASAEVERRVAENLVELSRIRAAFLNGISHELRTPLTNIQGFAKTIRAHHAALDAAQIEELSARLVSNTTRLERLVMDLLDLHRDGSGEQASTEAVHVEQLLRAAITATGPHSQQVQVWSPAQWVEVDKEKLARIVHELVDNVVRHTPPETSAWLHATVRDGHLHLGVEDDGPGVEPRIIHEVSQPFVQGSDASSSPSPGLGIGLALAARYAEQLGGSLTIALPDTGGTRVDVVVPHGGTGPPGRQVS